MVKRKACRIAVIWQSRSRCGWCDTARQIGEGRQEIPPRLSSVKCGGLGGDNPSSLSATLGVTVISLAPDSEADVGRVEMRSSFFTLFFDQYCDHDLLCTLVGSSFQLELAFRRSIKTPHSNDTQTRQHQQPKIVPYHGDICLGMCSSFDQSTSNRRTPKCS